MPTQDADLVARCVREGRARWSAIGLADSELAARIAPRVASESPSPTYVRDLFVTVAAEAGDPVAIAWLHGELGAMAPRLLGRMFSAADRDEVVQRVGVKLLVGDAPRIRAFAARGPIEGWLRSVLLREGLSMKRAGAKDPTTSEETWLELPFVETAPELATTWRRHAAAFRAAFEAAVGRLSTRERVMLRRHFIDGLSAEEIGRIYKVHRVTAYRWIVEARRTVLEALRADLRDLLGSASDVDSLIRGVKSDFSITLERVFALAAEAKRSQR